MSITGTDKLPEQQVGRYAIFDQLAAGGMATVHLARLVGSAGFSRVVAAKRMHRHFLEEPEFKRMFLDEARLAARIVHPNVVPVLDVLSYEDELVIFMEYVHGDALHSLIRAASEANEAISIPVGCAIVAAALQGLHAAHEARDGTGKPIGIVHRDVSPQNILVGADGVARVLDFGIAKAMSAQSHTVPGTLKGKFSYMAPEAITGAVVTRQADIFSAGAVLWEVLTGRKLFNAVSEQERIVAIVNGGYPSPREFNPAVTPALERVVARALQRETRLRYTTALEFAIDIERVVSLASQRVVGDWVRCRAEERLNARSALIHEIEISTIVQVGHSIPPPVPTDSTHAPIVARTRSVAASGSAALTQRLKSPRLLALAAVAALAMLLPALYFGASPQRATPALGVATRSVDGPTSVALPNGSSMSTTASTPAHGVEQPPPPAAVASNDSGGGISVAVARPRDVQPPAARAAVAPQRKHPSQPAPHGKHYLPSAL